MSSNALAQLPVATTRRGAVVLANAQRNSFHSVCCPSALILRQAIVRALKVNLEILSYPLTPRRLLQPRREIIRYFSKDSDLALNDFFLLAIRHMPRNILNESLLRLTIKDLFPQRTRSIEVLSADLRQESDGIAGEMSMQLIQIDGVLAEVNRLDGREVVWPASLIEERHRTITLEIRHAAIHAWCVDR